MAPADELEMFKVVNQMLSTALVQNFHYFLLVQGADDDKRIGGADFSELNDRVAAVSGSALGDKRVGESNFR